MSVSSMTGFARVDGSTALSAVECDWFFELKSVNGKSLDVKTKLPPRQECLAAVFKGETAKYFARGSLSVYLEIKYTSGATIKINEDFLKQLTEKAVELYQNHSETLSQPSASDLLAVKGVVEVSEIAELNENDQECFHNDLLEGFRTACDRLLLDRQAEGEKIKTILLDILDKIKVDVNAIEVIAETLPQKLKERLWAQISELLSKDCQVSEERLAQEICLYVARADIREEIDRLKAHIKTAENLLASGEAVGRRLDFLCQELNREANTTCSKSCNIEITNLGMELKTLIEQFREQVQNME